MKPARQSGLQWQQRSGKQSEAQKSGLMWEQWWGLPLQQ
jgi:hypothetical protein